MLTALLKWRGRTAARRRASLVFAESLVLITSAVSGETADRAPQQPITNLFQVRQFGLQNPGVSHPIRLEGQVCWLNPARKKLAMIDSTGGLILELEWLNRPVSVGQRLRLTGAGTITRKGNIFRIGVDGLIVDNDGLHPMIEQAGTIFLDAGRVPVRLQWFNGAGPFGLELSYEGPDILRQKIENSSLFHPTNDPSSPAVGLNYQCYEGWWTKLPDFNGLKPLRTGTVANFDLNPRTRDEGVALEFTGFLQTAQAGLYKFYLKSDDGSRLFIGGTNMQAELVGAGALPAPRHLFVGQTLDESEDGCWGQVEGIITKILPNPDGVQMELGVGLAHLEVNSMDTNGWSRMILTNSLVRITGFCQGAFNTDGLKVPGLLLVPDNRLIEIISAPAEKRVAGDNSSGKPLLTTVAEVHQLKREEAQLGYPVKVRGIVTSTDRAYHGFTLQDWTRGIYVDSVEPVQVGDFVEVEGVTDPGLFAPMLQMSHIYHLGTGRLPDPIRPTWDQLMNGSLDAQYVEIEGIFISAGLGTTQLLTQGGIIKVELIYGLKPEALSLYENALVRIRGGLIAVRNSATHQVTFGEIRICDPDVLVENSTPSDDAFSAPYKTPSELLLFDPTASLFQRIRMSGQIVHVGDGVCFMMAENSGVRFMANKTESLRAGDTVEVTGYPQLGDASPLLRATVLRKTGKAPLPEARKLSSDNLTCADCDATRVRVEGLLTGIRPAGRDVELEMQDRAKSFVARLRGGNDFAASLTVGSRLELTGVYSIQGENQTLDRPGSLFELLLNSTADIIVLARPPWWTLPRLLVTLGMLIFVLMIAALWITQLHRKVEQRTVQLEEQIQKRQSVEQHRAMEQERARVAHDLHDELGSGLTEIGMLAAPSPTDADSNQHLEQIGHRARNMVTTLDEIVWAMNPKHDSLESLGSYLCLYADRFLKLANITCHLKGTLNLPGQKLNPVHRHEFFLAFKEALTNVVRHSKATEVRLNIRVIGSRLRLSLADNGGGLASAYPTPEMDGMVNMRARLEKIGGRFSIATAAGRGTTLRFYLPLS